MHVPFSPLAGLRRDSALLLSQHRDQERCEMPLGEVSDHQVSPGHKNATASTFRHVVAGRAIVTLTAHRPVPSVAVATAN